MRISLEDLLASGAHFGHLTRRWNPKMKPYIFMERNGIHIIDLKKSQQLAEDALNAAERLASEGKRFLFIGTKKQLRGAIKEEAIRCGQYHATDRWPGGMLTNFATIRKSIKRLQNLDKMDADGTIENYTKKEQLLFSREKIKLDATLGGISEMRGLPAAMIIIDIKKEHIAVEEARKLGIPLIGIVDTNSKPEGIDYVIPGNDDAIRAIQLYARNIAEAILNGRTSAQIGMSEDDFVEVGEGGAPAEGDGVRKSAKKGVKKIAPKKVADVAPEVAASEPAAK